MVKTPPTCCQSPQDTGFGNRQVGSEHQFCQRELKHQPIHAGNAPFAQAAQLNKRILAGFLPVSVPHGSMPLWNPDIAGAATPDPRSCAIDAVFSLPVRLRPCWPLVKLRDRNPLLQINEIVNQQTSLIKEMDTILEAYMLSGPYR